MLYIHIIQANENMINIDIETEQWRWRWYHQIYANVKKITKV